MSVYLTPGPTELHESAKKGIVQALESGVCSLSHRSSEFQDIYARAEKGVRDVLSVPESHHIFFVSSATEAMERFVQNCVETKSHHFVGGAFAERFYKTAVELGVDAGKTEVEWGRGFELFDDIDGAVELVAVTQNETSTGVSIPLDSIYALKDRLPEQLLILDLVSAVPYADIEYEKIDGAFFSVQKGFGLPAGLGVMIVGPRAMEKAVQRHQDGVSIGSHHSFVSLKESAEKKFTPSTPNVLGLYLLGVVTEAMLAKGVEDIRKETEQKADYLYKNLEEAGYTLFVQEKTYRSHTIVVFDVDDSSVVMSTLRDKGIIVGDGYGKMKGKQIRIANFPMHTMDHIHKVIEVLNA